MRPLLDILNHILMLPESTIGSGIAALSLLGIVILRHYHRPRLRNHANIADWAALAYVVMQIVTLTYSKDSPDTVHFIVPYISALCLYFLIRLLAPWPMASTTFIVRVAIVFGAVLAFANLTLQIESISAASKLFAASDLSSIRASLPLAGGATRNDGLAVVLAILPFALSGSISKFRANRYFCVVSTMAAASLVTVLILGLSRAVYVALIVILIAFVILCIRSGAISFVRIALVVASTLLFAGVTVICLKAQRPFADTFLTTHTISEQMSAEGRLTIWSESMSTLAEHPLLGSGGGIDGILTLKRLRYSNLPFTARMYNAPLDTLTSSGLVGFAFYGIFLLYPLWCVVRTSTHPARPSTLALISEILAAGIVALIIRDTTYSSLVIHGATIAVLWIMVALVENITSIAILARNRRRWWTRLDMIAYIALGLSCASIVLSYQLERAEAHYRKGCAELAIGNYTQARTEFGRAIQIEPKQPMFYLADGQAAVVEALGAPSAANLWHTLSVLTKDNDDSLLMAEQDFRRSVRLSGDDVAFWSDLGWIEAFRGKQNAAAESFEHAIQVDPRDSASRIGAGFLYERMGLKSKAYEQYALAIAARPRIVDSRFFEDLHARDSVFAMAIVARAADVLKDSSTSPVDLASLAKLHAFMGFDAVAHDEYARALDALPNLSYTWANLGVLDLAEGQTDAANREFARALFLDGGNRLAANMLASVDWASGRVDAAEGLYARAILTPETSVHAERSWRLYHVQAPAPDDLVPLGLLPYLSPDIKPVQICNGEWLTRLRNNRIYSPDVIRRIAAQEAFCNAH